MKALRSSRGHRFQFKIRNDKIKQINETQDIVRWGRTEIQRFQRREYPMLQDFADDHVKDGNRARYQHHKIKWIKK